MLGLSTGLNILNHWKLEVMTLEHHNYCENKIDELMFLIIAISLTSLSSGNVFVSGAGGLRFKSRADQIGHSVANGLPPIRHFFKGAVLPAGAMMRI